MHVLHSFNNSSKEQFICLLAGYDKKILIQFFVEQTWVKQEFEAYLDWETVTFFPLSFILW